jgi:hypothetical protein
MSDRIPRMANITSLDEMAALLAQVCEILKRHEETLFDATADVEGLKAAISGGPESRQFVGQRDKTRLASTAEHDGLLERLDAAIQRLRGI